ncbi:mitochondrial fission factor-like isoform X2 [Epinephelus fuscoguttatus]|uniref:mitochondrial fission factor-like isoform X2 n=1 Tax=Epinephelus fuscoguttatus TaxID=293821 RepID=UPI0020D005B4|nr:mitochondrial fission factor-like isoform X2 [Epinephelus fuscoguttatus]
MMMAFTLYPSEMSQVPGRDPALIESINKNMRVPERLSVTPGQQWQEEGGEEAMRRPEEPPPAYTMHVPDRLTYTEAPDMSPRPLFTQSKPTICGPLGAEPCWESPSGEVFFRDVLQSPIRRSYSDQSFGRTPPGTPTQLKQALALPRHPSSSFPSQEKLPPARVVTEVPASALAEHSSKRAMENWSPEEEGGAAVEFIILRRQVMKMSRRLAALERHNADRRNTEVVLFSLLVSACLLNVWLWIRR